jgi:putative tryptophan/tyrosine transport system substrate-binding protein
MRWFKIVAALIASALPASAQAPNVKVPLVGIVSPAQKDDTPIFRAFRDGLREHGYSEGHNIVLVFRLAQGDSSALPRLVSELVLLPVDVIVTDGPVAAKLAKEATRQIPIVMGATGGDPVALGLVASLSRPGGNVTGLTLMQRELSAKRVDLLRAAFPDAKSMTVLLNPANLGSEANFRATEEAARTAGIATITRIETASPASLRALRSEQIEGPLLVLPDAMLWNERREILSWAASARAPGVYPEREYADDGGLIGYGPNVPANFYRAASFVARILKGASPANLPIEEPSKIDFVINLKTARDLGVSLPDTFVARSNEVIE